MAKYYYFDALESLAASTSQAVKIACEHGRKPKEELEILRKSCNKILCETEKALFSDFIPPLERDNIAACAHSLCRVVDRAMDLAVSRYSAALSPQSNEEEKLCIRLAAQLAKDITLLRHIRKPSEMPALCEYRALLSEAWAAHTAMLTKLHTGRLPRSFAESVMLCGRLRMELSRCFDSMVEIMLNNI